MSVILCRPMIDQGLSLYRRWRPLRFFDVLGQKLVAETLKRAVAQGRIHHAYLLSGQRGVGKTSIARILARAVNCLQPEAGEPCNRCDNCRRILDGKSLDVVEIDGASNRGIDRIRQLREEVSYIPAHGRYKVYIIDEVHMLTGEAFNALLKTLEEPPPHVIFIFATTEPHKVPSTVISRCQAFELSPIPEELIQAKLREIASVEGIDLEPRAAWAIARHSHGSLRDAEVLLDQLAHGGEVTEAKVVELLGLPTQAEVDEFLAALVDKEAERALAVVDGLSVRGRDLGLFLEEAAERGFDRIIQGEDHLIPIARRLLELRAELSRAVSRKLHLELEILALCGPPKPKPQRPVSVPEPAQALDEPKATWHKMLAAMLPERPSVAMFLAPAAVEFKDGVLSVQLPEDCGFHYESLQDPKIRAYVEGMACQFFGALLSLEIHWRGNPQKVDLAERARLLARAIEGKIVEENSL